MSPQTPVVTRFAPSPTGFLHIGGARTALFNWLFAKHHAAHGAGGTFLLRIEDTDRARSTDAAVAAIYEGLEWLGLDWDGDAVSQFSRVARHQEAVQQMLEAGQAYHCYCSPEELATMREKAKAEGSKRMYDGTWRDRDPADAPEGIDPVVRLKAPREGEIVIQDQVQGEVRVACEDLDDLVLLRSDGTPTYMLAVVVDDHDMGVTHVIRGDDHLTNAFRQVAIYRALGFAEPVFAHIPLIHGPDGAKMSKRHGALGVEAYRDMGFLPEAMRNYLLRLGWSHGDEEVIPTDKAIDWFSLENVGRAPSRFDFDKLTNLNGIYIRESDDADLADAVLAALRERLNGKLALEAPERLLKGMGGLKQRAKNFNELVDKSAFYAVDRPISLNEKALACLDDDGQSVLVALRDSLHAVDDWSADRLEDAAKDVAERASLKLGKVAQPARAALVGDTVSPSIFEMMDILGRDETLGRFDDALHGQS